MITKYFRPKGVEFIMHLQTQLTPVILILLYLHLTLLINMEIQRISYFLVLIIHQAEGIKEWVDLYNFSQEINL